MFENIKKHLYHIYGNNISVHLSGSTIEKIQTNIGLKCKTVDLVVIIHKFFNIAIVWNIKARREQGCNAFSLTYSKSWKNLMCDNHEILTIYKTFKAKECECYEKVIVLDLDTLIELSSCLPELLEFDSEDVGFPTVCKNSLSKETKIRTRNTTSRWNRDRKFSKGVLDAYHYQCAICRCDIPQLLEAAHEEGTRCATLWPIWSNTVYACVAIIMQCMIGKMLMAFI